MRCKQHPAFEADYCPSCGTARPVGMTTDQVLAWSRANLIENLHADTFRADLATDADARQFAADEYDALVRAMGMGFHPDTRGADYATLPDGYTAELVDAVVLAYVMAGGDPYDRAVDVFRTMDDEGAR
jgi:hypothetical protein